jgi:hypothetical protein
MYSKNGLILFLKITEFKKDLLLMRAQLIVFIN